MSFFNGAGQRTNRRGRNGLRNLEYGVEVSGAGNREPRFDDVHAEAFQQLGDFDLLGGVQLAARHLLAITERGVENKQFLAHNMTNLTNLGNKYIKNIFQIPILPEESASYTRI